MIRLLPNSVLVLILAFSTAQSLQAQYEEFYTESKYEFIDYKNNKFDFYGDSSAYNSLFKKFTRLALQGKGQINIIHIGDSHIQADIFSGRMRERIQTFVPGCVGGRGFVFPYRTASTNNPINYTSSHTGKWDYCRNVERTKTCDLGLSGISITTKDSLASISIVLKKDHEPVYDFNIVKVFHDMDSTSLSVELNQMEGKYIAHDNDSMGYTEFILDEYIDSLNLIFIRKDSTQKAFTLHGISLENTDPGIVYHSIGINGANVTSFLRCNLFAQHLKILQPDWVIISLGTNDAYVKTLKTEIAEKNFNRLIEMVREENPNIPILITCPGDNYRFRKEPNINNQKMGETLIKVAKNKNCAVWDLYTIMGGFKSVNEWQQAGLAGRDKLHFTKEGYNVQGDLLFTAFQKAFDSFIENQGNNK